MVVTLTSKILAVGLTVSQLLTTPVEKFKTHYDSNSKTDLEEVARMLTAGCNAFLPKDDGIDYGELLDTAFQDSPNAKKDAPVAPAAPGTPVAPATPTAGAPTTEKPKGLLAEINWEDMRTAFNQFCRSKPVTNPLALKDAIDYFNDVFAHPESIDKLKNFTFAQSTSILDGRDARFTDLHKKDMRRRFVSIRELPAHVVQAFISAEDKDFYRHTGVDQRGLLSAAISGSADVGTGKRAAGGSTITQQTIKNIYKHFDYTFDRKMREMLLAAQAEKILGKDRIMEIYLNIIPLGRDTSGIEMAAQAYFGKSAKDLTVSEAALLAGINKGPNLYNPDKRPAKVEERRKYVLGRMLEDAGVLRSAKKNTGIFARAFMLARSGKVKAITAAQAEPMPQVIPFQRPEAYYFVDQINRQVEDLKKDHPELNNFDDGGFIVHSTIDSKLQAVTELALQDGLSAYERKADAGHGRATFKGAVGSIADRVTNTGKSWKEILPDARADVYYDVRWLLATVLPDGEGPKCGAGKRAVGTKNGAMICLEMASGQKGSLSVLKPLDLVFVRYDQKHPNVVTLQIPPEVQGAAVVLENTTGKILAMVGGFSYGASTWNRVTRTFRQPGSTVKPFSYLYALNKGFSPNTLVSNAPTPIAPISPGGQVWNPRNFVRSNQGGLMTMRRGLENSMNIITANLVSSDVVSKSAAAGFQGVCALMIDLGLYQKCDQSFPVILGAQVTRPIDIARAYATFANMGFIPPEPYFIDTIERQDGKSVFQREPFGLNIIRHADRVSFYQLRTMLEGVVTRGTAASLMGQEFGGRVAGKTGTSQKENDSWFAGFTNDVTVVVWVGYDNPPSKKGEPKVKPRNLGKDMTGGEVAAPIAREIFRHLNSRKKIAPLFGPAKDIQSKIGQQMVDPKSGAVEPNGTLREVFRLEEGPSAAYPYGKIHDTQQAIENIDQYIQRNMQAPLEEPAEDGDKQQLSSDENGQGYQADDYDRQPVERRYDDNGYRSYQPTQSTRRGYDDSSRPQRVDDDYRNLMNRYGGDRY